MGVPGPREGSGVWPRLPRNVLRGAVPAFPAFVSPLPGMRMRDGHHTHLGAEGTLCAELGRYPPEETQGPCWLTQRALYAFSVVFFFSTRSIVIF